MRTRHTQILAVFMVIFFGAIHLLPAQTVQVSLWFDEGNGASVANHGTSIVQGTLREGTDTGNGTSVGPQWSTETPFNYEGNHSLYFDNSDHHVFLGSEMDFALTNFTLETWIRPESNSNTYQYISQAFDPSTVVLHFRLHQIDGQWQLEALLKDYTDNSWEVVSSNPGDIVLNEWQHVAITVDTSNGTNLYVNGEAVDSIGSVPVFEITRYLRVGNNIANSFQGWIDEFRVSDFVRVAGNGSGLDSSLAWNSTIGEPGGTSPDSARVAIFQPQQNLATSDGMDTYEFVRETLTENEIPFDLIAPSTITDRTAPDILYQYDLVILPYYAYTRDVLVQTAFRNYFYVRGKVIMFNMPQTSYGQRLVQYIYGMNPSYGSIPDELVLSATEFGRSVFTDTSVAIAAPSAFNRYNTDKFGSRIAMEFGEENYAGIVFTEDTASAFIAPPLTLSGTTEEVTKRKRLFAEVVEQTLASSRKEIVLPDTLTANDYGEPTNITLENQVLRINDEPFFPKGPGYVNSSSGPTVEEKIAEYAGHNHNTVVLYFMHTDGWFNVLEENLEICKKYGVKALLYFHNKWSDDPWRDEWMLELLKLRDHPAILGYSLVDDAEWWHYPAVKRWTDIIRKYDQKNLITTTLLDFRHPDRIAKPDAWQDWQTWYQRPKVYPMTYLYPLMRDGVYVNPNIDVGIDDIGRLAANVEGYAGYRYQHQWIQAHQQGFVYSDFDLSLSSGMAESFLASSEQLRLELYEGLISGVKGFYLFADQYLVDNGMGRGRRNESGLVFKEIDLVQQLILEGQRNLLTVQETPEEIEGASFTLDNSQLLVLRRKNPEEYIKYVDDSTLTDVTLSKNFPGNAYRIRLTGIDTLQTDGSDIVLDNFDLSELILVTENAALLDSVQSRINRWLPSAASEAFEVLKDKRVKTEVVAEKIAESMVLPTSVPALLDSGEAMYNRIVSDYLDSNYAKSYTKAREAMLTYRKAQRLLMTQARNYWNDELSQSSQAERYLIFYYGLPKFYEEFASGADVISGEMGMDILNRLSTLDQETQIEKKEPVPGQFNLLPNYPNPFNNSTKIQYNLPSGSFVTLAIFDIRGGLVKTLVRDDQPAGKHKIIFNADELASGVYFCRLKAGEKTRQQKMLYIK